MLNIFRYFDQKIIRGCLNDWFDTRVCGNSITQPTHPHTHIKMNGYTVFEDNRGSTSSRSSSSSRLSLMNALYFMCVVVVCYKCVSSRNIEHDGLGAVMPAAPVFKGAGQLCVCVCVVLCVCVCVYVY